MIVPFDTWISWNYKQNIKIYERVNTVFEKHTLWPLWSHEAISYRPRSSRIHSLKYAFITNVRLRLDLSCFKLL